MKELTYIENLSIERWKEYKDLKIEAIKNEPAAFSHELQDALNMTEEEWKSPLINKDGNGILVFAESEGKLIGMAGGRFFSKEKFKHNASLENLYVSPEYRGKGVGKELVELRMRIIKERPSVKNVICEVFTSQQASLELHKKLGFEVGGVIKDFLFIDGKYFDSVLLEKKI